MTQIYNTTNASNVWKQIAQRHGVALHDVISGRAYPRRFNSNLVLKGTQRRICELTLLDYCCLNLPLPDVCRGEHYGGDEEKKELVCELDKEGRIQPKHFPVQN